jgi:hypothetical protein
MKIVLLLLVIPVFVGTTWSQTPRPSQERVDKFKQAGLQPILALKKEGFLDPNMEISSEDGFEAPFVETDNSRLHLEWINLHQDSKAYELLTLVFAAAKAKHPSLELKSDYGTAGFATEDEIAFFRGTHFFRIRDFKGADPVNVELFVQSLSRQTDKGEGDIPVLIKHLPSPEEARKNALFLTNFTNLDKVIQRPVLSAVEAGGNADAVFATYGPGKVLLIEFNTPQLAADNDRRIIARIQELWKLGQPAPTAYRRVGNYSVFVFDAPDEATAKQLIDQVKYEQVVQWLGENPNIYKEAEKQYINTTLGVLVAVLKASGYALITCLGLGGLIGGLLFTYRRSQQREATAYSDAGGMLRLNLDELTPETDPARLLRERN